MFGEHATSVNVSSTKSMTGHMLGAAGARGVHHLRAGDARRHDPADDQLQTPDPECDLNYTPNRPCKREVRAALSNSFGFGGHNVTLAVKRFQE